MAITIRKAAIADGRDVYDMLQAIPANENGYMNSVNGMTFDEFRLWLISQVQSAEKTEIEDGWKVPQTTYWLCEDGVPLGTGRIRHFLTDALREEGGNIAYALAPSARGRGLGKELLRLLIGECRKMGMERALITVQNGNEPSARTALANGAVMEKKNDVRGWYWIEL
ncbi:MAG: GNAT family N-acetyltransferase [Eubacteriales bacterium]|nr:GNAT family N-acetyltransferase [Eubacteriales bacterium]